MRASKIKILAGHSTVLRTMEIAIGVVVSAGGAAVVMGIL